MKYNNIVNGKFIERPNRFIAHVEIDGKKEVVHVKNTGRCRELLQEHAEVFLEKSSNPERKTAYDLVVVKKGERLINMDSQAPNKVVEEWLYTKALFPDLVFVRPETKYSNSRFDFYIETSNEKIFMEVKGVTLENNGVVSFPDAPSERAIKHVDELIKASKEGYKTYVLFVVQMKGVKYFIPSWELHPDFAQCLEKAKQAGVNIVAYDCLVTPDTMVIDAPVEVRFKENILVDMVEPLLNWYNKGHRILPWRERPTPYRVWVSEIMLQQTRVEAVKPYFERFMETLPDIYSLAVAEENILLKLWEGLGYYNRVRNLQKAAIQIIENYDGIMPSEYEELLKLKGIGSYTAGAIASIAYAKPIPAVDGNVLRVVSRVRMDNGDIASQRVKRQMEEDLLLVMPEERSGDFNQAMMEIGATVCIPSGSPHCEKCPLAHICLAFKEGATMEYPKKSSKKARTIEEKTILIVQDENKAAIHKRPTKGLLAGLYEFPTMEGYKSAEEVVEFLGSVGLRAIRIKPLEDVKHVFSHKEWHMRGYSIKVDELAEPSAKENKLGWLFIETKETEEKYPIPSAFAAYARYLNIRQGNEIYKTK